MLISANLLLAVLLSSADTKDVEALALAQRQAIKTLDIQYSVSEFNGPRNTHTTRDVHVWIDGDKIREDYKTHYGRADVSNYARSRFIVCINCERPGWGIEANDDPNMATLVAPLKSEVFNAGQGLTTTDPRVFGYSSNSYGINAHDKPNKHVRGSDTTLA